MIFTRHFGALAARPTFNDALAAEPVELEVERLHRDVETEPVEHQAVA